MPDTRPEHLPAETVAHVRDACLCLATQRAARQLARRFDAALKPCGLTNGQFSLMMALNRPEPPPIGRLGPFLGMDASTLTAMVKPLVRRDLLIVEPDPDDRRLRRLRITAGGVELMRHAVAIWQAAHAALDAELPAGTAARLRQDLSCLDAGTV